MKTNTLYLLMALLVASVSVNAQDFIGTAAPYIQVFAETSLQADSIYPINKASAAITVDGVAESAWSNALGKVISKAAHQQDQVVDLDTYPQTEAYAHATFKALWTVDGVYMFITVKDDNIRYQNPGFQWENDGIEFYFAKDRGEGKIQIIIPAMVGTTHPDYPAALNFESGSATGSQPEFKVLGYDATNWDESLFIWAIKKTAAGWDMEVYMDKDIVTNGNSTTNYGLDKIFAGDINLDIAGLKQNTNEPALYVREHSLCMLGNSSQQYASSNNYGYFQLVDQVAGINSPKSAKFNAIYNAASKEIEIISSSLISSVEVYNLTGQVMLTGYTNSKISVSNLKQGIYLVKVSDQAGNILGVQKVLLY